MKYFLFGAGTYGTRAISLIGKENVEFILDNDSRKWGTDIEGIPILNPQDIKALSVVLGHSSVALTLNRYVHVDRNYERKLMNICCMRL